MPGQLHITPFCAPQQMDDENPYDAHISGTARGYPKPFALWELRSTQSAHRISMHRRALGEHPDLHVM